MKNAYTVRKHIYDFLKMKFMQKNEFLTHDIQNLSQAWFSRFNYRLGSTETYTREFRRMRTDGVLKVRKLDRKNRQQIWELREIQTNFPNDVV